MYASFHLRMPLFAINSDCFVEAYYYCFFNYMNVVSMNICVEMLTLNAK